MENNFLNNLEHPIGLAAGYDKTFNNSPSCYAEQGFSWVEYGSITAEPNPGNRDNRVFYPNFEKESITNNMGMPNRGSKYLPSWKERPIPTGLSIGFSSTTTNPCQDFKTCIINTEGYFDYYTVNLSCPNVTRNAECEENIELIRQICEISKQFDYPILLKMEALLNPEDQKIIAEIAIKHNIAGLIITNTMGWKNGATSGKPLFEHSNYKLKQFKDIVKDEIPLIGCGGILSVEDAQHKMDLGATALQLYTGYYFYGKQLITKLKEVK